MGVVMEIWGLGSCVDFVSERSNVFAAFNNFEPTRS